LVHRPERDRQGRERSCARRQGVNRYVVDLKPRVDVSAADMCSSAVNLILSDDQFSKLISGKANAQKLYMSGKLKVKGDVMKATKMEPILKKAQNKAKL
jgi:putative sterol carrier protein